jgi:hypothetical protein
MKAPRVLRRGVGIIAVGLWLPRIVAAQSVLRDDSTFYFDTITYRGLADGVQGSVATENREAGTVGEAGFRRRRIAP